MSHYQYTFFILNNVVDVDTILCIVEDSETTADNNLPVYS